jgi:hypothetical protein
VYLPTNLGFTGEAVDTDQPTHVPSHLSPELECITSFMRGPAASAIADLAPGAGCMQDICLYSHACSGVSMGEMIAPAIPG